MAFKVAVDQETCIGCAACTAVENTNFEMDGEKAKPLQESVDDPEASKAGEETCPVEAISVVEE